MTKTVDVNEASVHLSRLIDEAVDGADMVISVAGQPMVRSVPVEPDEVR